MMPVTQKLVLCVDDEVALLRMLRTTLEIFGYAVLMSTKCDEALQIVRDNKLDAVILDYAMPGRNGAELAHDMKQERPETLIIMFSGSRPPVQALMPVDGFVSKEEGATVLVSVLEKALEAGPTQRLPIRKFPRYQIALPFVLTVQRDDRVAELHGYSTDIGEGGLGGKLVGDLIPGELVDVQISDSQLCAFHGRAQVRYRNDDVCGLEFLDIDPSQQSA
jgi:CheY-like chemotaxis protein